MLYTEEREMKELNKWEKRFVENCEICHGTGVKKEDNFYVPCICTRKAKLFTRLVCSGVPTKYLDWKWEECEKEEFVNKAKKYGDNFEKLYEKSKGLFIYGTQGKGKTTIAALIARDIAKQKNPDTERPYEVMFLQFEDLIQWNLQKNNDWRSREKLNYAINNTDLLVMDNIGSETGFRSESKTNVKLLDKILRTRDNDQKPYIITSNFTIGEMVEFYSDTIGDFISENCMKIEATGKKFRNQDSYNI